jgi:O-succinylbenzoic acid--CoA ligase
MTDWLASAADAAPNAPALIIGAETWTYRQLSALVDNWCGRLAALGVWAGQPVAASLPNGLDYVCLVHALARLGAILVPINTRLTDAERQWQVEQSGAQLVITSAQQVMSVRPILFERAPLRPNARQSIVFTSGTTGTPKGAQITYGNLYAGALASAERLGASPDDRWLCPLPFYHVGGFSILFRSPLYGSAVVLPPATDADSLAQSLHASQSTIVSLVPTMLHRMLDAGFVAPPSLRLILVGGAAASPQLIERCLAQNLPLSLTYGMTETASQIATMPPKGVRAKQGSVGKPLAGTSVRIVDESGNDLPLGQYGEIVVSGGTVMRGYLGQPPTNGTLHTGDIGYLDADGDLWLVQRRSDLIVTGGENVYPSEVENALRQHPSVADACVVGVPDAEWGQSVAAMVALHDGSPLLTAADLITFARQQLAGYKVPRSVAFVRQLPLTASGKIHRQAVQEQLAQSHAR